MLSCDICGKEFEYYRALNGHKSTHGRTEEYSRSRRSVPKQFNCIECGVLVTHGWTKLNKYCGPKCEGAWRWKNIKIPDIEAGKMSSSCSGILKKYLREKFGDNCSICRQLPVWNGAPLQLQLDHIDGNSDNSFPINLRLLCPNCHTQTDNFGSRGQGSRYHKVTKRNKYIREYRGTPNTTMPG